MLFSTDILYDLFKKIVCTFFIFIYAIPGSYRLNSFIFVRKSDLIILCLFDYSSNSESKLGKMYESIYVFIRGKYDLSLLKNAIFHSGRVYVLTPSIFMPIFSRIYDNNLIHYKVIIFCIFFQQLSVYSIVSLRHHKINILQ